MVEAERSIIEIFEGCPDDISIKRRIDGTVEICLKEDGMRMYLTWGEIPPQYPFPILTIAVPPSGNLKLLELDRWAYLRVIPETEEAARVEGEYLENLPTGFGPREVVEKSRQGLKLFHEVSSFLKHSSRLFPGRVSDEMSPEPDESKKFCSVRMLEVLEKELIFKCLG